MEIPSPSLTFGIKWLALQNYYYKLSNYVTPYFSRQLEFWLNILFKFLWWGLVRIRHTHHFNRFFSQPPGGDSEEANAHNWTLRVSICPVKNPLSLSNSTSLTSELIDIHLGAGFPSCWTHAIDFSWNSECSAFLDIRSFLFERTKSRFEVY